MVRSVRSYLGVLAGLSVVLILGAASAQAAQPAAPRRRRGRRQGRGLRLRVLRRSAQRRRLRPQRRDHPRSSRSGAHHSDSAANFVRARDAEVASRISKTSRAETKKDEGTAMQGQGKAQGFSHVRALRRRSARSS